MFNTKGLIVILIVLSNFQAVKSEALKEHQHHEAHLTIVNKYKEECASYGLELKEMAIQGPDIKYYVCKVAK